MTMVIIEEKFGIPGYAFWFKLLEMLGSSNGHYIDCSKASTWEFIQAKNKMSEEKCCEILDTLAKLDAIDKDLWKDKIVWSDNFIEGISIVYDHRTSDMPTKPTLEIIGNRRISENIGENSLSTENIGENLRKSVENPVSLKKKRGDYIRGEERENVDIGENSFIKEKIGGNKNHKGKDEVVKSVFLTTEEYSKLIEEFGEVKAKNKIEALSLYKCSKGKEYVDDYATILSWDRKDKEKNPPKLTGHAGMKVE
jgi:hypothetical protein